MFEFIAERVLYYVTGKHGNHSAIKRTEQKRIHRTQHSIMADRISTDNQMNDVELRLDKLARDVLELSRNTLLVNLRFMDAALARLIPAAQKGSLSTDGEHLFYDARFVLRRYMAEKELPVRDYLHTVLHCVLHHNFETDSMEAKYWNLACDMAVENIINGLNIKAAAVVKQEAQIGELAIMQGKVKQLTAEKIYHQLCKENLPDEEIERLGQLFLSDDHMMWYDEEEPPRENKEEDEPNTPDNKDKQEKQSEANNQESDDKRDKQPDDDGQPQMQAAGQNPQSTPDTDTKTRRESIEEIWRDIAEHMQVDLETFSKGRGDAGGTLIQNLRPVTLRKYDYTTFLKKFAVTGDVMKINDDEFDYIFYTYGLKLYKKMPLIEPLEYKEDKRIREFVIAIDTSGSVEGELVQKFIEKTYNILKQSDSFFKKTNLHIIQCDAEIQEDIKITRQEELEDYIKNLKLRGFGGTDFRPVFEYVEKLREDKEFTDLKGLIYFTDGDGTFPKKMPDYKTAFIFLDNGDEPPAVPPWALRLVLQGNDI